MRKWIVHIFLALLPWTLYAGSNFDEGVKSFEKKEYETAITKFRTSLNETPNDIASYYNLGLAYHETKSFGNAIWAFEKALKLSPSDAASKQGIQRSYAALDPKFKWEPQLNRLESALYGFSGSTWSIIAIIFSILLASGIVQFVRTKNLSSKRLYFALSGLYLFVLVSSVIIAMGSTYYAISNDYVIVTKDSIVTYTSSKKETSAKLLEGERLLMIDRAKSGMINVSSASGDTYYVKSTDVAFI